MKLEIVTDITTTAKSAALWAFDLKIKGSELNS